MVDGARHRDVSACASTTCCLLRQAHIAYIPNGRSSACSKMPRIVDVFARRLQVQERLTEQIAPRSTTCSQPLGVGVVIEAHHLCMMMRGVEKQNSRTITSAMRGMFRGSRTRDEFLSWPTRCESHSPL